MLAFKPKEFQKRVLQYQFYNCSLFFYKIDLVRMNNKGR